MSDYNDSALEIEIKNFGKYIFESIGKEQPSAFDKNGLNGRLMQWSMKRPELKINMFRLVDVLPTLKTSAAISSHAIEYLEKPAGSLNALFGLVLKSNPG